MAEEAADQARAALQSEQQRSAELQAQALHVSVLCSLGVTHLSGVTSQALAPVTVVKPCD